MLCTTCKEIFARPFNPDRPSTTHDLDTSLRARVLNRGSASCQICALFDAMTEDSSSQSKSRTKRSAKLTQPFRSKKTTMEQNIFKGRDKPWLELMPNPTTIPKAKAAPIVVIGKPPQRLEFTLESAQGFHDIISAYEVPRDPLSASCRRLWNDWLNNCLQNHPKCNVQSQSSWMPTRLLYLHAVDGQVRPQLREFKEGSTPIPYSTLSHCWGGANILKLLKSNIEELSAGIDIQTLPKTFRDAIYIAQTLGFEYIWIDSLCIIQDSKEDWKHEAARMGDVYKNSRLNIAATGAVDSSGGCFFPRDPVLIESSRVDINWVNDEKSEIRSYFLVKKSLKRDLEGARLNCRAWVLQERLLSPRVLHFGRQQLFWECRELEACESYPSGLARDDLNQDPNMKSAIFEHEAREKSGGEAPTALFSSANPTPWQHWAEIVGAYSRSGLTFTGDRLIALHGVVTEMKRALQDEYLAGLWRRSLLHELLWTSQRPKESFRPDEYRAPSWSWLSVEGEVSYGNPIESLWKEMVSMMPELIEAQVGYENDNHSQIINGSITLKGRIGVTSWNNSKKFKSQENPYDLAGIIKWDGKSHVTKLPEELLKKTSSAVVIFDVDRENSLPPRVLYCFPIISILLDDYDEERMEGLLLTRDEVGNFRRVGRFSVGEYISGKMARLPVHTITIV